MQIAIIIRACTSLLLSASSARRIRLFTNRPQSPRGVMTATSLADPSEGANAASETATVREAVKDQSFDRTDKASSSPPRALFVWDFDWTVVNCNSDEYVPSRFLGDTETHAGFRAGLKRGLDWHSCVESLVNEAMSRTGAAVEDVLDAARRMPYLTGVRGALDDVRDRGGASGGGESSRTAAGQMILSDGNTLFIEAFLDGNGLRDRFDLGVVSNVGRWERGDGGSAGRNASLRVVHQSERYGGHDCPRCVRSPNLCKTQALRDSLDRLRRDGGERPRIVYVGDGANDACPALNVLDEGDVLLARAGTRRTDANRRTGAETDDEAVSQEEGAPAEGSPFGILPALQRAADGEDGHSATVPNCRVMEWRNGEELRSLVRMLLEDVPRSG